MHHEEHEIELRIPESSLLVTKKSVFQRKRKYENLIKDFDGDTYTN